MCRAILKGPRHATKSVMVATACEVMGGAARSRAGCQCRERFENRSSGVQRKIQQSGCFGDPVHTLAIDSVELPGQLPSNRVIARRTKLRFPVGR